MAELLPYQIYGRAFLLKTDEAMLADQPGLGKTCQAITALRFAMHKHELACIICPRSAKENWKRELDIWWPGWPKKNIFITHYEALVTPEGGPTGNDWTKWSGTIWNYVIVDEAHRLKTPVSKRTKAVYGPIWNMRKAGGAGSCRVWLLTGTPAKNHAGEVYTHLAALKPDLLRDRSGRVMSHEQFEDLYCNVGFDEHGYRRIRGSKNTGALRALLDQSGFLLRRRKKEVQKDLPDLFVDDYPLPVEPGQQRAFGIPSMEGKTGDEILEELKNSGTNLSNWQHNVARYKIPIVQEYLENELEVPGTKIIVFYKHRILGQELYKRMSAYSPVILDGHTQGEPQDLVDEFQNNPNCQLFFGQISVCQEALNITAATQVAFAEFSWSPSDNYQAMCRAHRMGMGDSLVVRFLSLAGTPDEIVARVCARKALELEELFD